MRKLLTFVLFSSAAAVAQLEDNTITITANRQATLQPDQILFSVQVFAPPTAGIDDVLAKIPGIGVTAANLYGVYTYFNQILEWNFTLAVPLSQADATTSTLVQLAQKNLSVISFGVQGTQVSQALQQSQPCSQASLISDAQTQAQSLAAAAGFTVGPVLAVSDGSGVQTVPLLVAGSFLNGLSILPVNYTTPYIAAPSAANCTAVVKFQLYAYH